MVDTYATYKTCVSKFKNQFKNIFFLLYFFCKTIHRKGQPANKMKVIK